MNVETYAGPLIVTLIYLALYYGVMISNLFVKNRLVAEYKARGEKYDRYFNTDREQLAADRKTGNTLEHMAPFLALMWLTAVFAGAHYAAAGGAVYTLTRVAHPLLIGPKLGRGIRSNVLVATFTGYAVLLYFFVLLTLAIAAPGMLPAWG